MVVAELTLPEPISAKPIYVSEIYVYIVVCGTLLLLHCKLDVTLEMLLLNIKVGGKSSKVIFFTFLKDSK